MGQWRDLVVCGHLHTRSHGADSPVRADLPSCNEHPFSEVRFHGASESQSRCPPPKQGPSIMLPLFCFLSFSSLTSHLLNPAFTPDLPLHPPSPYTHTHTVLLQTLQVQVAKTHLKLACTNKKNVLPHIIGNIRVHLASIMIASGGSSDITTLFFLSLNSSSLKGDPNISCNGQVFSKK